MIFNEFSFDKKCFKQFIGFKDNGKVEPLCIMLPKMSVYAKNFDKTILTKF